MPRVVALYTYPVKSCAAVAHASLAFTPRGAWRDREWMLVDERGHFVSQRHLGELARLRAEWVDETLHLRHPALEDALVLSDQEGIEAIEVQVWRHTGLAIDAGARASEWLRAALGQALRLVRLHPQHGRMANTDFAPANTPVAYTDGYPLLICAVESLGALNARLEEPVEMLRFRPNVVIEGAEAFAEDAWTALRTPGGLFLKAKPCVRCRVPQLDPHTGAWTGKEPLRTLTAWRMDEALGGPIFGTNYTSCTTTLKIGDVVEIVR